MKFVFVESFQLSKWNGYNARYIKGVSGSHNGPMYLAEALASFGHEVIFISMRNMMESIVYKNVRYMNYEDMPDMDTDVLVTTNNIFDYEIFQKLKKFRKVVLVIHNELYNDNPEDMHNFDPLFKLKPSSILVVYVSKTSRENFIDSQSFLRCCNDVVLPNSIDLNDVVACNWEKKMKSFVFFTAYERGMKMVSEILNKTPNFILWTNTYNENERKWMEEIPGSIYLTADSSKHTIFNHLAHSRYFIYPLIDLDHRNPNAGKFSINTDTFGYTVLEALLHGVVVLTPRMAVYEEWFGDAICYIDTDDLMPRSTLSVWKQCNENLGYPILYRYIAKIHELEANPALRLSYVEKGYALKDKFSNVTIANQLIDNLYLNWF
jgi:hypothetical protein